MYCSFRWTRQLKLSDKVEIARGYIPAFLQLKHNEEQLVEKQESLSKMSSLLAEVGTNILIYIQLCRLAVWHCSMLKLLFLDVACGCMASDVNAVYHETATSCSRG